MLMGQTFTGDEYLHPRPSAAAAGASGSMIDEVGDDGQPNGKTAPVDPKDLSLTPSGASNLGPTNDVVLSAVADRVAAYCTDNGLDLTTPVSVDAATTSASGLDPHISVADARLQIPRVAAASGLVLDLRRTQRQHQLVRHHAQPEHARRPLGPDDPPSRLSCSAPSPSSCFDDEAAALVHRIQHLVWPHHQARRQRASPESRTRPAGVVR